MKTMQTRAITTFAVLLLQLPAHATVYEFTNRRLYDGFEYGSGTIDFSSVVPTNEWQSAESGWQIVASPNAATMPGRVLKANNNSVDPTKQKLIYSMSGLAPTADSVMLKFKFRDMIDFKGSTSLQVRSGGQSWFEVAFNGGTASVSPKILTGTVDYVYAQGTTYEIIIVATQKAGGLSYVGPDNSEQTLASARYDLWVNGTLVAEDGSRSATAVTVVAVDTVQFKLAGSSTGTNRPTHLFDEFEVFLPVVKDKATVMAIR